jgi:hypothetical protein
VWHGVVCDGDILGGVICDMKVKLTFWCCVNYSPALCFDRSVAMFAYFMVYRPVQWSGVALCAAVLCCVWCGVVWCGVVWCGVM